MGKAGPLQWPRSVHYALPGHQRNLYPQAEASRTDHPASGTPQATEPWQSSLSLLELLGPHSSTESNSVWLES